MTTGPGAIDVGRYSTKLTRDADGIWVTYAGAAVSYPRGGHAACRQVEDASFWFRHRNRCIVSAARRYLDEIRGPIFDVGGGNGFVALGLGEAGFDVVLVEPGLDGARNAQRRGLSHVVCATTEACAFQSRSIPAIGLFDVVEHICDDKSFLLSMAGLLVERGYLLLTVPAYAALWSGEDVLAGHFRRYTRSSICGLLQEAGFSIAFASYFFRPLPVPIFLLRALPFRLDLWRQTDPTRKAVSDHAIDGGLVSRSFERILANEVDAISRGEPMAFGASLLVVARAAS